MEQSKFYEKESDFMDENKKLLDSEVTELLKTLKNLEPETDEYRKVADRLEQLYKLSMSHEKQNSECADMCRKKKEHRADMAVDIAKAVLPIIGYGLMFAAGLKFEETGTVSSLFVRNVIGKIGR